MSERKDMKLMTEGDEELIGRVRSGDGAAFDVLYSRHAGIARALAMKQTDNESDVDDVVSEAFSAVFQQLLEGKGPDSFFRAYLIKVVSRLAHARNRATSRVEVTAEWHLLDSEVQVQDPVLAGFEAAAVAEAFSSLPERWQAVLWYVDVENLKPAAAATFLGISPNAVSSLALRARERLRTAYLQFHISGAVSDDACRPVAEQLGAYARNKLKRTTRQQVRGHLDSCARCTALLAELAEVHDALPAAIIPLITGLSLSATGYLRLADGAKVESAAKASAQISGITAKTVAALAAVSVTTFGAAVVMGNSWQSAHREPTTAAVHDRSDTEPPAIPVPPMSTPATPDLDTQAPQPGPEQNSREEFEVTPEPQSVETTSPPTVSPSNPPRVLGAPAEQRPPQLADDLAYPQPRPSPAAPLNTPTPSPSISPPTPFPTADPPVPPQDPADVSARLRAERGTIKSQMDLQIAFRISGEGTLGSGEVFFSLSEGTWFAPRSISSPAGWTCSLESELRTLNCSTKTLDRSALDFAFTVSRTSRLTTVDYYLEGPELKPTAFFASF
ncbi:sigma-70 family RNA polymerase sigma factor (plasmid) [Paenarthrobacter sp. OM7]|uniref:sigma-70 family RNA polymerase sigma factor n=1 Tax=Paenarthrobacter sp. OM7 TaxID=3041264 RepID=UPI002469140F|nr:sigma-70 family RNA polymerase sigma factor [Paenarthrobacter sp. OM7]WGM22908.1 sigma-70 family RNA polymerase sigma factor [Paenarthrobacter sp. OM7]